MFIKVFAASLQGIEARTVTIEVNTARGIKFFLVGLPDVAVKESHERIMAALQNTGHKFPNCQITINMAPADLRKEGAGYDLPLCIGILAASGTIQTDKLSRYILIGELSLDGSLQPVNGILPIAIQAWKDGFEGIIVPQQNVNEASVVNKLKVFSATTVTEVIDFFNNKSGLPQHSVDTRTEFYNKQQDFEYDFSAVRGQENVKRALEVAAAGGHNLIMVGSPGSGKSMMAKCLPSILPPLSIQESLETTKIYSVAGKLQKDTSLIATRPFRSPHHTISSVALVGGGSSFQPGEISLAHNGVLFADELPEFSRNVLEMLRQPLEDRHITISRVKYTLDIPCSFMFIASMNPCPCGYYNHPSRECVCSPGQIQRYMNKISGPLLDRIDIQTEVTPVPFEELSRQVDSEPSSAIRKRVCEARKKQEARFKDDTGIHCNAQMTGKLIRKYAKADEQGLQMLKTAMIKFNLSARAYDRILKVARTIADLTESEIIQGPHIAEAISYRNLDRSNWGE